MDIDDALQEFVTWGAFQQVDVLAGMDTHRAAAILQRCPIDLRKELLSMMEPFTAANIVQVQDKAFSLLFAVSAADVAFPYCRIVHAMLLACRMCMLHAC